MKSHTFARTPWLAVPAHLFDWTFIVLFPTHCRMKPNLPIPTKPPVYNGMIAPRDSWMMPPPCNEMIPPGAPRLLA